MSEMDDPFEMKLFALAQKVIHEASGNWLTEKQRAMVSSRLHRRRLKLGIDSTENYYKHFSSNIKSETKALLSLLTTHYTFFFREFVHFEKIKEMLPELASLAKKRGDGTIRVWSAACSRGHEVYSLAMWLEHWISALNLGVKYEILGTDIDPESVKYAQNGVYPFAELKEVPMTYLSGNWSKGTGSISQFAKVKDKLKKHCRFTTANLVAGAFPSSFGKFDIILCRNVLIYFQAKDVEKSVKNLMGHLTDEGALITGLSESLISLNLDLKSIGASIYVSSKSTNVVEIEKVKVVDDAVVADNKPAKPIRLITVDDSPTVITLIKKSFEKDVEIDVVATAANGIEAHQAAMSNEFDIMILDIHMPEMNGLTYLERHFGESHPPVIIMSSASREDEETGFKALKLGASDFVEKPEMSRLKDAITELKVKIKTVLSTKQRGAISDLDRSVKEKVRLKNVEDSMRFCVFSAAHREQVGEMIQFFHPREVATVLLFEGQERLLDTVAKDIEEKSKRQVFRVDGDFDAINKNTIYLAQVSHLPELRKVFEKKSIATMVFGVCSPDLEKAVCEKTSSESIVIEDVQGHSSEMQKVARDIGPWTSFYYLSNKWLKEIEDAAA